MRAQVGPARENLVRGTDLTWCDKGARHHVANCFG